jgi:16S rRNA (cytosine967-C5)-methyltransferase
MVPHAALCGQQGPARGARTGLCAIRACGPVPESGRAALLRLAEGEASLAALFDGSRHAPAPIVPGEPVAAGGLAPHWLSERLAASGVEGAEALLARAPLDVRVNTLKADRATLDLPLAGESLAAPQALRFPETPVEQWDAYARGQIEVQDGGSQLVCEAVAAQPGETVIDLCAGAGGKTLALAAAMATGGGWWLAMWIVRGFPVWPHGPSVRVRSSPKRC